MKWVRAWRGRLNLLSMYTCPIFYYFLGTAASSGLFSPSLKRPNKASMDKRIYDDVHGIVNHKDGGGVALFLSLIQALDFAQAKHSFLAFQDWQRPVDCVNASSSPGNILVITLAKFARRMKALSPLPGVLHRPYETKLSVSDNNVAGAIVEQICETHLSPPHCLRWSPTTIVLSLTKEIIVKVVVMTKPHPQTVDNVDNESI